MVSLEVIEWTAVVFNVAYVVLAWYRKKVCWLFGAIGSALSVYYFQHESIRLYSEAGLYVFYIVVAIYGWWAWSRPDDQAMSELSMGRHALLILAACGAAYGLFLFTSEFTDAARPLADSLSTVFGVLATFLTIKKILSNWIYWIVIDLFSVWLYLSRDSEVYAVQMAIFAVLAIIGYIQWRRAYQSQSVSLS